MAAGMSARFAPLSFECPKGLLRVKGEVLEERQICQLQEAGVSDITLVVDYKAEMFSYLKEKMGVEIVMNDDYYRYNRSMKMWAPTFILFHWGPLAWGFYVILAVCFGFMMHVKKRERQSISEACRPLLGDLIDGVWGKFIDVIAILRLFALQQPHSRLQHHFLQKP